MNWKRQTVWSSTLLITLRCWSRWSTTASKILPSKPSGSTTYQLSWCVRNGHRWQCRPYLPIEHWIQDCRAVQVPLWAVWRGLGEGARVLQIQSSLISHEPSKPETEGSCPSHQDQEPFIAYLDLKWSQCSSIERPHQLPAVPNGTAAADVPEAAGPNRQEYIFLYYSKSWVDCITNA